MNQELKQRAYQLLIDKIDVVVFEQYLYELVERSEMKNNSLLFDFVSINYKKEIYKKVLYNLLKDSCSEEELLSLKIYEYCLRVIETEQGTEVLNSLQSLSDIYFSDLNEINIVYSFYIINMYDCYQTGYDSLKDEEAILKTKENATKVLKIFKYYRENENWSQFLSETIEEELIEQVPENKIILESKTDKIKIKDISVKKDKSLFKKLIDSLKGISGLR